MSAWKVRKKLKRNIMPASNKDLSITIKEAEVASSKVVLVALDSMMMVWEVAVTSNQVILRVFNITGAKEAIDSMSTRRKNNNKTRSYLQSSIIKNLKLGPSSLILAK